MPYYMIWGIIWVETAWFSNRESGKKGEGEKGEKSLLNNLVDPTKPMHMICLQFGLI